MRAFIVILSVCCYVAAKDILGDSQRIAGGQLTTIDRYPSMCAALSTWDFSTYVQSCGGSILNSRSVLTAAHCVGDRPVAQNRVRVGSSWANSGGVVHILAAIIKHPLYNIATFMDADIAILRTATAISFNVNVQMASIAGPNYNLGDNQVVWATGWGRQWTGGPASEQLRDVQLWTVNQQICQQRYGNPAIINDNMLCVGRLDVGGFGQCPQDSGGPVYHNGVVVGVCSFGAGCGEAYWPSVNARVSRFTPWIQANA